MKNNYNKAFKQNNNHKQNRPSYEQKNEDHIKQNVEDLNEDNIVEQQLIEENTEVVEEEHKPTYIGLVSGAQKVYMRSEANKESEPVEIMDEGAEVEIIEDSDPEWYKICNSAGVEGFMMKQFITI